MEKTFIKELPKFLDKEVALQGWVYNFRSSGKIAFLQLRDGTGFCQAIVNQKEVAENVWGKIAQLTLETSVRIQGRVSKHPKKEEYELQATDLHLIQVAQEYPIGKKEHGPDFLLQNRHLWLRSPKQWAIQQIRHTLSYATYEWMEKNFFTRIDSPILTPAACEGTTTLFEVPYFDLGKAYLSQSGQLYLEAAIFAHGRAYDFGPVFRAEKSKTRRHLTEFWMMDAEMAFVEHAESLKLQEDLISFMVSQVLEKNQKELAILERDPAPLEKIKAPFIHMTHAEAVQKLRELGSKSAKEDDDLGGEDETILSKAFDKPIFIEKYPAHVKAFYMKRDPADESRVLCADMIAPEGYGEIIGGSQREEDIDLLLKRLEEHQLPQEAFLWYLDLRKFGSVPHSGFGYGLERIVSWVCGIEHVREAIPFPRMIYRISP
ncbi:MAG: asparagine--tRNA ligase [Deltaproteobacteria bacterium]|nr:asparagine--tRNA ligase [Deltaproteobacteria bacterium]